MTPEEVQMFSGCEVFSSTMHRDRDAMGPKVTAWLEANPELEIVARDVLQSSDSEYHCVTIVLWYRRRPAKSVSW